MILSNKSLLIVILFSLSIAPAIFLGEGNRNLLLIGVIFITPIFLLKILKIEKIDILFFLMFLIMLLVPYIVNTETYRISTVLYSGLFGFLFITYKQLLNNSDFTIDTYLKLIKFIIYAYFIVLLIQQFCVLTGLPIFNISNYEQANPWKLNSLSAEPSHTGRIVPLLMFSYIVIKEFIENRKYSLSLDFTNDKYLWFAFSWIIFTSGSATAYLFFILIFLKFLSLKNSIYLCILILLLIGLINFFEINSYQRTLDFFMAVLTLDINKMMAVDHSASIRIAPLVVVFNNITVTDINGLFGNGIDTTSNLISKYIYGIPDDLVGGGTFQLWYEYGFIVFILFIIYTFFSIYDKNNNTNILFWFLLVFIAGINSQMVWLCMVLLYTNKYFKNRGTI